MVRHKVSCRSDVSTTRYFAPNRGAEYSDDHVCLSVCLSVCVCLSVTISPDLQVRSSPIFVHVTYSRGSVLLWWRCDVSRISSCTDDIIFAHSIPA